MLPATAPLFAFDLISAPASAAALHWRTRFTKRLRSTVSTIGAEYAIVVKVATIPLVTFPLA